MGAFGTRNSRRSEEFRTLLVERGEDGGILIGKVYGHLSNEHAQAQAARLNFGPTVVTLAQAATA